MRKLTFLFAFLLTLLGGTRAWASTTDNGDGTLTEGFDEFNATYSAGVYTVTMPTDWAFVGTYNYYWTKGTESGQYKTAKPSIGNYLTTNTNIYIVTPLLQGDFSFWMRSYSKSYDASIAAYECTYENDQLTVGSKIGEITIAKSNSVAAIAKKTISYTGHSRVALLINAAYFDDFTYTPYVDANAVAKPTEFTVTGTTYNSATFSWTAGGTESAWQLLYGTSGFNKENSGTQKDIARADLINGTYTLNNLTENTTYEAYLRAKIEDDVSSWTSKVTFTTPAQYPAPTGLAISGETTTTATLSWTAGSNETAWKVSYSTSSDFSTSTEVSPATNPQELSGLTANTTYYAKVRADYGNDNYSNWTEAISFKTLQEATSAASYSDNFETANNWDFINGSLTNAWAWGAATNNGGEKSLYISNDGGSTNAYTNGYTAVYATKLFAFSAGEYTISYDWKAYGEGGYDFLRVSLAPANTILSAGTSLYSGLSKNSVPSGWIAIDGGSELSKQSSWQSKSANVNIPAYANYYVVFAWYNDSGTKNDPPAAIDNFSIIKLAISTPADLGVINLTSNAATIGWTSEASTWNIRYKVAGDSNWSNINSVTTNPFTITGLSAATSYEVQVQAVDGENSSNWSSSAVFTTDCATIVVDSNNEFAEDFSNASFPLCWTINNENKTSTSGGWSRNSNGYAYSNYYGDTYLVLPLINIEKGTFLTFDQYFTYMSSYGKSSVVVSTSGTAASDFTTTLWEADKNNYPTSMTTLETPLSLSRFAGQDIYIAFKYEGNNAHGWYVDNIRVYVDETIVPIFTDNAGYTTFASSSALDLANLPGNLKAYYVVASGVSSNSVKLTEATEAVPESTPLIFKGTINTEYQVPVATTGTALTGNLLVAGTGTSVQGDNKYVLVKNQGVFKNLANGATIPAGKAYLDASSIGGGATRLSITFEDETTTGIATMKNSECTIDGMVYNLNGQRVNKAQKGLYIVNGKKVVRK